MEEYTIRLIINEGFIDVIRYNIHYEKLLGIIYTLNMLDKITDVQCAKYLELLWELRKEQKECHYLLNIT